MVGKYFVLWWIYYVFPYHETGLLKWLPENEYCLAINEVMLIRFWARLYCDKMAMSKGWQDAVRRKAYQENLIWLSICE